MPLIRNSVNRSVQQSAILKRLLRAVFFVLGGFLLYSVVSWVVRQVNKIEQKNDQASAMLNQDKNNFENEHAAPVDIKAKENLAQKKYTRASKKKLAEITANAYRLANALGTRPKDNYKGSFFGINYDLFNISAATEDEKTAVSICKKHTGTFPILEDFYYTFATNSRNLKDDLYKYLNQSELNEIRASHRKYGNYTWL